MKWFRVKALIGHYLYSIKRNPSRLIDLFFWPVFDLMLWGFLTIYLTQQRGDLSFFTAMILGALIFWSIFYRVTNEVPFQVLDDVWSRNFKNLLITPLSINEFLTALFVASLIKVCLTLIVLLPAAFLLYSFNIFKLGFVFILLFSNLLIFCFSFGMVIAACILRFGERLAFLSWITATLVQPLACVFYPRQILPLVLQKLSYLMPISYVFENLRRVLGGQVFPLREYFISLGLNLFYFFVSFLLFKFLYNWARKKGTLVKT